MCHGHLYVWDDLCFPHPKKLSMGVPPKNSAPPFRPMQMGVCRPPRSPHYEAEAADYTHHHFGGTWQLSRPRLAFSSFPEPACLRPRSPPHWKDFSRAGLKGKWVVPPPSQLHPPPPAAWHSNLIVDAAERGTGREVIDGYRWNLGKKKEQSKTEEGWWVGVGGVTWWWGSYRPLCPNGFSPAVRVWVK